MNIIYTGRLIMMYSTSLGGVKNSRQGILRFWGLLRQGKPSLTGMYPNPETKLVFIYIYASELVISKKYLDSARYKKLVHLRI